MTVRRYAKPKLTPDEIAAAEWAMAPSHFAIGAILSRVDAVATEMERKWGVGRLRLLVSDLYRAKFDAQQAKLDRAIQANLEVDVQKHGDGMVKAWQALDKAATEAGLRPLPPTVWELTLPSSGQVLALVRDAADASMVQGRPVFTLEDLAALLDDPALRAVVAVKAAWPTSTIGGVNHLKPVADDAFWKRGGDQLPF